MNATLLKRDLLDKDALRHACEVAARTFRETAETLSAADPNALLTVNGLRDMKQLFEHYQARTEKLLEQIDDCDQIVAETEGDSNE